VEERRVEYGGGRFKGNIKQIGHLKEVENLEALDQVLITNLMY